MGIVTLVSRPGRMPSGVWTLSLLIHLQHLNSPEQTLPELGFQV